jgi:hypothetical protein
LIISFKLKHVDLDNGRLDQDARQVGTKREKTFSTWFFPVGENIGKIVADWVTFLRTERGFGPEDPIFPKARVDPAPISSSTQPASHCLAACIPCKKFGSSPARQLLSKFTAK